MTFHFVEVFVEPKSMNADVVYPDPEVERDVYEAPTALSNVNYESQDIFELLKTMQGTNPLLAQPATPSAPPIPESPFSKFISSKIPILILALIVYVLFALDLQFVLGGTVFSSLIVWEILEFFLTTFVIQKSEQQGGLVNLLFIFGGISQEKTKFILRILALANKLVKDIAIFMFTFVIMHLFWSFIIAGESMKEILDKDFSKMFHEEL